MNNSAAALFTTAVLGFASAGSAFAQGPSPAADPVNTGAIGQGPGNTPTHSDTAGQVPDGTPSQASSRVAEVTVPINGSQCSDKDAQPPECRRPKHGRIELGVGYQPDDGFMAQASIAQGRLFGTKHRLRVDALLTKRRQYFGVKYGVPRLFGSDQELDVETYTKRRAYKDFALSRVGGSFQVSRSMGHGFGIYSRYRLEQISTDFTLPQAVAFGAKGPDIGFANESGIVAAWRSGVTYDNGLPRNRRIQAGLFSEISSPWLGSDYSMTRAGAKASYRQPLIGPFGLHLQGGLEGVMSKEGTLVPRAERLYFEGHSDVRGFGLGSAGMDQGSGFKATSRVELEFEIVPRWGVSGALFYDAGFFGTGASSEVAHSVGGSLIMDSSLGSVRLDLALPLDGSNSPMVLLGIGDSF